MMESLTPNMLFVLIGLGLVAVELIVGVQTGFDLVLLGTSLIFGGLVGNWMDSWQAGLGISLLLTIGYMIVGRKFVKSKLAITSKETNIDQLIGKEGLVVKDIVKHSSGQVKVGTETWRAVSDQEIKKGTKVKIQSIEGVTLKVV
jgi:membrane protein implicated in regulation of membrane protease activity